MIFLGPNKTETMFMIFFDTKHRLTDISGFTRDNLDFFCIVSGYFMFMYRFLSIKLADIFGLQSY